nr:hypothetical protein [Tanacetum cinerariifolium]
VNTPRSDEDRLKLMELMVFLLQKDVCDEIGITVARLSSYCCQANFWNTASVKRSGDVTRLQALVDKKKIVISEAVIREILQLNDAEGVVCLANEEIFAGLAQMGYEKPTSWNEFSTAMASAVICLSKGHKFNFSKYIFDSLTQVGDLSTHTTRFISTDLTQKVFANMSRVGKGFSGVETPLFEGMLAVRQPIEEGVAEAQRVENLKNDNAAQKLVIVKLKARVKKLEKANKIKSLKLRRLRKVEASRRVESFADMEDFFNQGRMIDNMDIDEGIELVKDAEVAESEGRHATQQEVVEVVTTAKLITEVVTATALQVSAASATIPAAKPSIPADAPKVVAAYTRRRNGVIIRDLKEKLPLKTPAETPKVKDKGKGILVETPKPMKKKDQIELDAEYAKKLHEEINKDYEEFSKDIDWDAAIDHNTAGYKMDFFKGMTYAQICLIFQARFDENMRFLFKSKDEMEEEDQKIIKRINETPAQKATKRRKLSEEAQEAKDLRKRLEVVEDEDDDVFVEATPLASKLFLLVERRYPLSRFTLEQLVNVTRLQVEEESEMSLELLKFTGQQL